MMNATFNRVLGIILIAVAAIGLLLSLAGTAGVLRYKGLLLEDLTANVDLAATTLTVSGQGLAVADRSLTSAVESITALTLTLQTTSQAIGDTTPMFDNLVKLTGEDLPATIAATQTSLDAAQESAKIIDDVLRALTFFNRSLYNPQVPLDVALGQVSTSLDPLPQELAEMEASLSAGSDNLARVQRNFSQVSTNVAQIQTSLSEAQGVVRRYQELVSGTQVRLEAVKAKLPGWVEALALIACLILVWMAFSQVGLLALGVAMARNFDRPTVGAVRSDTPE